MKHLLDGLQDELTTEEQELASCVSEGTQELIATALELRTALKLQVLQKGLYLTDSSIDTLTAALLHL
jgi:hypothetical protein